MSEIQRYFAKIILTKKVKSDFKLEIRIFLAVLIILGGGMNVGARRAVPSSKDARVQGTARRAPTGRAADK
jgi:hypothetical protein